MISFFFDRIAFITIAMMQESVMGDGRRLATVASEVEKTLITKQEEQEEQEEEGGGTGEFTCKFSIVAALIYISW